VVSSQRSLLTGVEASAAQKPPVTKTCPQCGCVLASNVQACNFCDTNFRADSSSYDDERESPAPKKTAVSSYQESCVRTASATAREQDAAWHGELGQRLEAYRARRGKPVQRAAQSHLPFVETALERQSVAVVDPAPPAEDDFSFTIAIGRYSPPNDKRDGRMMIDVSVPPGAQPEENAEAQEGRSKHYGLYPVASLEHRRVAAVIDGACLLFAYGGFLALFSSLGGQFTLSKLTAAVYLTTFAIVYLQYFALFTVFGGTTPGMMFRGLQVASFNGAPASPRQLLLRSLGYMLSASACFTGFLWAWWDEDALTWHDRISRTYLTSPETRAHIHAASVAHGR
jgi:uncharacterized RDD family membrane protein YckC